jgi:hypothetical protein
MIQKDKTDCGRTGEEEKINRWEIFLFCTNLKKWGHVVSPQFLLLACMSLHSLQYHSHNIILLVVIK